MIFKRQPTKAPLKYYEEKSYMQVLSKKSLKKTMKDALKRIEKIDGLKITGTKLENNGLETIIKIKYNNTDYELGYFTSDFFYDDYIIRGRYYFTEENINDIKEVKESLVLYMKFSNDIKESYFLQLNLCAAIIPDLTCVIDESAEKAYPKKWVLSAVNSKAAISNEDLYGVQAVTDKSSVWIHSHGLNRCGITELEILDSNKENYDSHYNLLKTYASHLIDEKKKDFEISDKGEYIGILIDNTPVVTTALPWTEALKHYKGIKLGGEKDRKESHNGITSVIFLYTSEKNEKNKKVSKVSYYDKLWKDNPIFFISTEETNRMQALARERFDYVKREFKDKDNSILIKIGLPVSEKYGNFEHIWFELLEFDGKKFKARLTQEPYDIKGMHKGDEAWFEKKDVTDWIIYTKEFTVTPNNTYLLD